MARGGTVCAAFLAGLLQGPTALAQDEPATPEAELPGDPKVASGITLAAIGATSTIAGSIAYAQGIDRSSECFDPAFPQTCSPRHSAGTSAAGLALLTSGVSASVFGLVMLRSADVEDRAYPASNGAMMGSGIVLTGIATSGVIGAQALWIYSAYEDEELLAAAPVMFLVSGSLYGAGLPLWLRGARAPQQDELSYAEAPLKVRRSPAMMVAGIGMTGAGVGVIGTGIGVGADIGRDESDADASDDVAPFFVIGSVLAGGTLIATGVPLWVKGAKHVPIDEAYADADLERFAPEVRLGPGAVDLKWTF